MRQDCTAFEATTSALVCTVTEPPAVGVLPIVKPDNVTMTAVLAASVAVPLVMTMDVAPGAAADRVAPPDTAGEEAMHSQTGSSMWWCCQQRAHQKMTE